MALQFPLGVSNKHIHISAQDRDVLFGKDEELHIKKDLKQPGQYAAEETVTIVGPKGQIPGVRVLGPLRKQTQVELAITDARKLGVAPVVRESGDLAGSSPIKVVGPKGEVELSEGAIIAARHVHLDTASAEQYGFKDKQTIAVRTEGPRSVVFENVIVRVSESFVPELHLDTDEANAAGVGNNVMLEVVE